MTQKKCYLGVDGGATKSTAVLTDFEGRIIKNRRGRALNYHAIGAKTVRKNLAALIKPLLKKAGRVPMRAVFGFAGLDTKHDEAAYRKIAASVMPKRASFTVVNDAKIALEAQCPNEKNRLLIISGTGANVYGESGNKTARSIGWDFLLGDEGSSYEMGFKALRTTIRSWDGRDRKTVLEKMVLRKIGAKNMEELQNKVYELWHKNPAGFKVFIASFSVLVHKAILKKDRAALAIRDEAARELLIGVRAVARRLKFGNRPFCIGITGSGWKMKGLEATFKKSVKKDFPRARFSSSKRQTVYGALMLACQLRNG